MNNLFYNNGLVGAVFQILGFVALHAISIPAWMLIPFSYGCNVGRVLYLSIYLMLHFKQVELVGYNQRFQLASITFLMGIAFYMSFIPLMGGFNLFLIGFILLTVFVETQK